MSDAITQRLEGPAPVMELGRDLLRRGILVAPLLIGVGAAIWGADGAASVGYGLAIVVFNFFLAAWMLSVTGRISFAMMGAAAMFGFLIRLGLIFVAFWVVKDAGWFDAVPFGVTIIVSHLGLLFWELRYVSASLAYPGLKPRPSDRAAA